MLEIENTKNFRGITVKGDYDDLYELYMAVMNISDLFHEANVIGIEEAYKQGTINGDIENEMLNHYGKVDDYLKSLNYDIRHAYQGDRKVETNDQGVTLYSFDILYPLVIFYLTYFTEIEQVEFEDEAFKNLYFPYDSFDYKVDQSIIDYFDAKVWQCLESLLSKNKARTLREWLSDMAEKNFINPDYFEAFTYYYCEASKSGKYLHGEMLIAMVNSLVSSYDDNIYKESINRTALKSIKEKTNKEFLSYQKYMDDMEDFTKGKKSISEDEWYQFIEDNYGRVNWDKLIL